MLRRCPLLLLATFTACEDGSQAPNPDDPVDLREVFQAEAFGDYETPIFAVEGPGGTVMGYARARFIFNEHVEYVSSEGFFDAEGTQPLFRYESIGPYEVIGRSKAIPDTWEVNFRNTASFITLLSDQGGEALAALGLDDCPLEVGVPVDVSNGCGAPIFAVTDCTDQDLASFPGGGLALGEQNTDRCVTRPTSLGPTIPRSPRELDPETPVGFTLLREALVDDAYHRVDPIIELLEAELEHRDDAAARGQLGVAHFWKLSQYGRAVAAGADPAGAGFHAMEQIRWMTEARQDPDYDRRIDSWLGGTLFLAGQETNDPALIAQGQAMLEAGETSYPEFNLFTIGLLRYGLPVGAPGFGDALTPFLDTLSACTAGQLDRNNPDYRPFDNAAWRAQQKSPCYNGPYVPHGLQGFMLYAGDAALLDGKPEIARRLFENARDLEGWEGWSGQAGINARLADNLAVRSARLRDADGTNDPATAPANGTCSICHAR